MTTISLEGMDKSAVLAALYNASRPQGMGFMQYDPTPMTTKEAEGLLKEYTRFDYLKGRVMKINLEGDELDIRNYDRDNGAGAAEKAIKAMLEGDIDAITEMHQEGKKSAAETVRAGMQEDTSVELRNGMAVASLGLSDVADRLGPKVEEALK